MTHTPGPWRIGPKHRDGTFAVHADKASVVHCTPFGSSNGHAESNARLIAAAPELLEALERSVQYLVLAYHDSAGKPDLQKIAKRDHELVCAAIAKAKGE